MDEDQNSENVEFTTQDQESTIVAEGNEEAAQDDSHGHEESQQEKNFRALRKKAEQNDRENQELKQRLRAQEEFMKQLMQQNAPRSQSVPEETDEFAGIDPTEYTNFGLTAKFVEKKLSKMEREIEKKAEQKYLEMEQKREASKFRDRLKSKYADFDDVVNSETIALLEEQEPELANTIAELKDPYKMGLQTYNLIKGMNFTSHMEGKKRQKEVTKKLEKNEKTIQSPQAYNKRPMAQAFSVGNMSEEEKTRMYEEMMGYARNSPGY